MNPYERAIYGFQCLHLDAMLQVSSTWEDCLWAELRVFRDAKLLKVCHNCYFSQLSEGNVSV
jgi:hypothetical protein